MAKTSSFFKKYANNLALYQAASPESALLEFLSDLSAEAESVWDYNSIRYDTVMTSKAWQDFVMHPERIPYKSKFLPEIPFAEKKNAIVDLLADVYEFYKEISVSSKSDRKFLETLKQSFSGLLDSFLNAYYDILELRFIDTLVGRFDEDRDNGVVDPTLVSTSLLKYSIREYAYFNKVDFEPLYNKILNICGGRSSILSDYYASCQMPIEFRKTLRDIFQIMNRNKTLSVFSIKIGWEVWQMIHKIGFDTDSYLKLFDFPKFSVLQKRLLAFLQNEDFVDEYTKHFQDEFPRTHALYEKEHEVDLLELTQEESERKNYPQVLRSDEEIAEMIEKAKQIVFKYLPLAQKSSPRNILLNPMHPAATNRAFQSSTRNQSGKRVNVIVMTPRGDMLDQYLPTFAHESTHAIHRIILELGEIAGVLEPGATERVPSAVMEHFSTLVDDLFEREVELPYKKAYEGKFFPNFQSARTIRFQAPYALVQLGLRKEFDQLMSQGVTELSEWQIKQLSYEFDTKLRSWMRIGLPLKLENPSGFGLFSPYSPLDGLVYLKKYVIESKQKKQVIEDKNIVSKESENKLSTQLTMSSAFEQRFSKMWLEHKDARIILLWLLLETGRNHASEDFGALILNIDPAKCLAELTKIGVSESDI